MLFVGMHQMLREALARMINEAGGFTVFAHAATGHEAVDICRRQTPDILVITVELDDGNGIEIAREVLSARPQTKVILIQGTRDEDVTLRALRSGALGLVFTRAPASLLIDALRTVAHGRSYVAPPTWDVVLNRLKTTRFEKRPGGLESLSLRQRQVLAHIIQGRTASEIAAILGVAVSSIRTERATLMRRMDVKTTPALILAALTKGFEA